MTRILSCLAGRSTTPTTLHTPRPNLLPCPGGRPALRARGLAHGFGAGEARTTVLRHVDLDLRRGELALIMGPSGSGKSTLLAALSGLMRREAARERLAMVLVVTHDARLVPYADRVFHLDDGRLSEPDEDALSARHAPREGHPYSENAVEEYTRALRRDRRNAELYRK